MQPQHAGALRYYQFESLNPARVTHAVFARHGGVSPAPYGSLNLSVSTGDARDNVRANRLRAFQALGRAPESVADLWQVHSARVVVADTPNAPADHKGQADTLITDRPDVTLLLRFADCVPILLADPVTGNVAAVHAGWRGVEARILQASVTSVTGDGSRLVAAIGPCIGACCFEVGEDVAERIAAVSVPAVVVGRAAPKAYVDLRAAVRAQLRDLGLADEAIEDVGACTRCNPTDYHSFRRDGEASGRLLAVIVAGL